MRKEEEEEEGGSINMKRYPQRLAEKRPEPFILYRIMYLHL